MSRPAKSSFSILIKEAFIDTIGLYGNEADFETLKHIHKGITIYEFNSWHSITPGLLLGFKGEGASRDDYASVGPPHHRTTKISNMRRSHSPQVSFTLEENGKTHKRIHLQRPYAIYSAVA